MKNIDALFSPFRLNGLDLPNRVIMAPMGRSFAPGGVPTEAFADYYRRRAENGVALILTGASAIDRPAASNEPNQPFSHGDAALTGWKRVVDEVHNAGGRIALQLWHAGHKFAGAAPDFVMAAPYEGPSGFSTSGKLLGHPMTEADIIATIDAFTSAAVDAEKLGFDGIELHGAHNYLIDQFFWGYFNRRTDHYGGETLVERSRFAIEILKKIRSNVARDFPVVMRLSQWREGDPQARLADTPQLFEQWLGALVNAGVDAFHFSQRMYRDPAFPKIDDRLSLAGWGKKLTGLPTIAAGSVGLSRDVSTSFKGEIAETAPLDDLLERLERREFDLVAVGRSLLQDPAWLRKVREGRGDEISGFDPEALKHFS